MAQAHHNLTAIPAGKRCARQSQCLRQHQRIHRDSGIDEAMRTLLGVGIRVFMHLQGQDQHDNAQHGQQSGHNPRRTNQRQSRAFAVGGQTDTCQQAQHGTDHILPPWCSPCFHVRPPYRCVAVCCLRTALAPGLLILIWFSSLPCPAVRGQIPVRHRLVSSLPFVTGSAISSTVRQYPVVR